MSYKTQSRVVILLVSFTALTLIMLNFYSSKIRGSIRSYINGESLYSKGQKDALLNLTNYLNTGNENYWNGYIEAIRIPNGDNKARHAMVKNEPDSVVYAYFIEGGIHEDDIERLVWMYKNFGNIPAFKQAVDLWDQSELILIDVDRVANQIKYDIDQGLLNPAHKDQLFSEISNANHKLTKLEVEFSNSLSSLARKIERLLNYVNVLVIILTVGGLTAYLMLIIRKLYHSKKELEISYDKVYDLNLELDTFVYSLSHDLRAPLTSLQGLVKVAAMENEVLQIKQYISMMDGLLDKQDLFLRDVISLLQRRDLTPKSEPINIVALVNDIFMVHQYQLSGNNIKTELHIAKELETIYSDIVFVKIIFNNLISNAFKYYDSTKTEQHIIVRGSAVADFLIFEIEDNGIGISKEFHDKIFEMFYVLDSAKRGTGLGLYIIKQSINKLNGTIEVDSSVGKGSVFTILLPKVFKEVI